MTEAGENFRYQCELAASLLATLGYDAAIRECEANGWGGALEVLLQRKRPAEDQTAD